ncbi:DUF4244 domain-containing protein [Arthrobacter sp. H14]|uniref:DUF4244 domain-containing protein n=1 Tax=Arthrobacter sp. H14 TaxID=1312959 RepID=UPI0004B451DA|nr:DUF4244 domain-containing protein [Arthrobacter sp. H14]
MSLSYRKARTTATTAGAGRAYQLTRGNTGLAAEQISTEPEPGTFAAGQGYPEAVSTGGERGAQDNVVELFPGASGSPSAGWRARLRNSEAGMATAEYAIATLAAVGFAGLLVVILRSDEVRGFLMTIIEQALTLG